MLTAPLNLPAPGRCQTLYFPLQVRSVLCFWQTVALFWTLQLRHHALSHASPQVTHAFCRVPQREFSRTPQNSHPIYLCRFAVRYLITQPQRLFLDSMNHPTSITRRINTLNVSALPADLPTGINAQTLGPGQPTPGMGSPQVSSHRNYQMYWNINQFPIGYAFLPLLRGRLTLGRVPLPRKPQIFGGKGSHLPFRYSCLHSLF
eukprot:TRINITY_DN4766_c0_g1_i3.p1 TRINITY_DN4766_c0_g1~~TRINITY_DN4766_c0_g1_i3.p1  ORF type:complete len:204 (-),score=-41.47 TRINITY_DN4766_c0_g1_i3:23-634(-)